jgi:predicted N-acyltransferase
MSAGTLHVEETSDVGLVIARLLSDTPPLLSEPERMELVRRDTLLRRMGWDAYYALARAESGEVVGLLPGYVAADRANRDHVPATGALLGSDGFGPSMWTVRDGHGVADSMLLDSAIRHASRCGYKYASICCLPERRLTDLLPHVPARHMMTRNEEAVIDLGHDSFEDYIAAMNRSGRYRIRQEMSKFKEAGLLIKPVGNTDSKTIEKLAPLLWQVESKHRRSTSLTAAKWYLESLYAHPETRLHTLGAFAEERLIAFQILHDMGTEWWLRCYGCDYQAQPPRDARIYFCLAIYEPIRLALSNNADKLVLGTGSLEAKTLRGAYLRTSANLTFAVSR